jgi:hypothetical protein
MEETKTITKSGKIPSTAFLKARVVKVKFIPKPTKEITNPNHVAYGRKLDGTYDYISPPRLRSDKMKNILTDEEKQGLEFLLRRDLSIYGDFWRGYKMGGMFPIALGKEDKILKLDVPEDYIIYKVLLNSEIVAKSLEDMRVKPRESYRYVLIEEGEDEKADAEKISEQAEAFTFYSKYSNDRRALRFILSQLGKRSNLNAKLSFLQTEVGKSINVPKEREIVLNLSKNKNFEIMALLEEAWGLGVVDKINGNYFTKEGEPIASEEEADKPDIHAAGRFLSSPFGQEMRLAIEKRVENATEK